MSKFVSKVAFRSSKADATEASAESKKFCSFGLLILFRSINVSPMTPLMHITSKKGGFNTKCRSARNVGVSRPYRRSPYAGVVRISFPLSMAFDGRLTEQKFSKP